MKINFLKRINIIASNHKSCRTVSPTRYFKENNWHYVGMSMAFWAKGSGQHRTNRWQLKVNLMRPTSFVNVEPKNCQQIANVGPNLVKIDPVALEKKMFTHP